MKHAQPQAITVAAVFAACTSLTSASIIDLTWIGPDGGLWHNTDHWNPDTIPNNGGKNEYHAIINTKFGNLVNLGTNATISELTIGIDDQLLINNGRVLIVVADPKLGTGTIHNAGLIELGSSGGSTSLRPDGDVVLTGGGTVRMSDSAANWIYRQNTDSTFLNVDNVIEGAGNLSWSGAPTAITNQHIILANAAVNALTIQPANETFTNQGTLRAEGGGTLRLNGGTYDNSSGGGGLIEARAGSTVELNGSAIILGGTLDTEDDGLFIVTNSTPEISDLSNNGHIHINNARTLLGSGAIVNTGVIELGSTGSATYFRLTNGDVVLTGGGTVRMSDSAANWIYRQNAGDSLLNVDNVIEGAGNLSWFGAPTAITNQHLIIANAVNALSIQPATETFTNQGTLRAEDGGTLQLNGGTYNNAGGLIEARAGSTVELNGSAIILGGTLDTEDDGLFIVTNSTPEISDLSNNGHIHINNARVMLGSGAIVNTGVIELGSSGSATYFRPTNGELVLTGGGTVLMSDNTNNWIYRQNAGDSLLNVDNVIEGAGNLGWPGAPTAITNQHLIRANAVNALTIQPATQTFTNQGTLRAENGGTLQLNGGTYNNAGGLIEARAGSTVELNGSATILGGTLDTEDDGLFIVTNSTPEISDLSNNGHIHVNNARTLLGSGAIVNTGVIELGSSGSATYFRPTNGELVLTGGGTVLMSDNINNRIYRQNAGDSLLNVDNVIRGGGNLGWSSVPTDITNQGTILADSTVALAISGHGPNGFVNEGLLEVTGTGGITSSGGTFTNLGQLTIHPDRAMARTNNLTQAGGTLSVNGTLTVTSGSLLVQGGVLNGNGEINGTLNNTAGVINPGQSTDVLTVNGAYMQSATGVLEIEINGDVPIDDHDVLNINGTAQLGGVLRPIFDDNLPLTVGDEWTVLLADVINGAFTGVLPCQDIRVRYENDTVIVEYTGITKIGDLNCDGMVDTEDLFILLSMWGDCADPDVCPADLNDDEVVDTEDLFILLANWG